MKTLQYNHEYSCNKERIVIGHCRRDSDTPDMPRTKPEDDYCQAYYPDRPKMGGFEAFGTVLRGDIIKTLSACGAFGNSSEQPASQSTDVGLAAEYNAGVASFNAKNYAEAIEHFKKSNRIRPSSAAYVYLGGAHSRLKQYTEAAEAYKQAIRMVPKGPEAHYGLGAAYERLEQYDKAETEYREAIRLDPDYQSAYMLLGETYYFQKKYADAITASQTALRLKADDVDAYYVMGLSYNGLGKKAEALQVAQRLEAIDKNRAQKLIATINSPSGALQPAGAGTNKPSSSISSAAQEHLNKGNQFYNDRDFGKAIAEFQAIIALKPEKKVMLEAYSGLAESYSFLLDINKAIPNYLQMTILDPEDSSKFWVLGSAYFQTQQYAKAATAFKEAIRLKPTEKLYYSELGQAYLMLGQKAAAMQVYESLLKVDKDGAKSLLEQINDPGGPATVLALKSEILLLGERDLGPALRYLKAASLIKPANPYGLMKVAEAFDLWDLHDEAIDTYRRVIALKPKSETQAEAFGYIGQAYNAKEQYAKAIPELKESLRIKPDDYMARELGNSYFNLKDYTNALAVYQQAVTLKPDNADGHYLIGMTYAAMNQFDKSIAAYTDVARLEPKSGRGFAQIGKVNFQLRKYPDAGRAFSSALRIDPKNKEALLGIGKTYLAVGRKPDAMRAYTALKSLDEKLAQQLLDDINRK